MSQRVFTTYQVAELLGATPGTVMEWMDKGWLPFDRQGDGPVSVTEEGLTRFLETQGVDKARVMAKVEMMVASVSVDDNGAVPPSAPVAEVPAEEVEVVVEAPAEEVEVVAEVPAEEVEVVAEEAPADPADQIAQATLKYAVLRRASELHLEPTSGGMALRARIDGVLHEKENFRQRLPDGMAPRLVAHLKAMAGLDVDQCALPQAGEFTATVEGKPVALELATCPTQRGEKVFIRLMDGAVPDVGGLGLGEADEQRLRSALARPEGLVVLVGPPRGGRADTLKAMLASLAGAERNALAIAASADGELDWVTHCRVIPGAGFTFAEAVRAFARQRPEVIAISELRDPMTAGAALEAALAGSMVLAGFRAPSVSAAVAGLREMGLEPWPLASMLAAVVEQRTVRTLCPKCRQEGSADDIGGPLPAGVGAIDFPVYAPGGCGQCGSIGYAGSAGLFEVLPMEGAVLDAIRAGAGAPQIQQAARRAGMKTLAEAGVELVRTGVTSVAELARVL